MNYRHAYHAGNFADVFKHAILVRILDYLKRKDKPFRVIDTHAGRGFYDLGATEAEKTGEWREGIERVLDAEISAEAATLLAPYLGAVKELNGGGPLRHYPGSPALARHLLRARDRLTAIELHPEDAFALKTRFAGDFRTRVIELDGWLALGAHLPPKEKRGLVLIDPPFEQPGEFERMADGLVKAHRRWPGGIYAFWYPVKDHEEVAEWRSRLRGCGVPKILDLAISVRERLHFPRLEGCGMTIVNPPYALEHEMRAVLPALAALLADGGHSGWEITWLAREQDA